MSCTPNGSTAPAFLTHFQSVEDPRQQGKVLYPLEEIFLLVLCGVISGADGWTSIAIYGQKKLEFLRRFLPFENGTPSHDQLGILFSRLDMEQFQSCFISWVASLNETLEGVVAVAGRPCDGHSILTPTSPPSTWFQLGPVAQNSLSDNVRSMTNPMRSRRSRNCWNCLSKAQS